MASRRSSTRGFKRTASVLGDQIRRAGETRGFAVGRVLTHWAEIVGQDLAAIARPVNIGYGKGGFGATLTVLTTGAQAPMLEMQKEQLRERVNAAYGYNAISRVRITQTAPVGFAEGQATFDHRPKTATSVPRPEIVAEAAQVADGAKDEDLRAALERLAQNVLSRQKS
ncbi:DUF721 domain-containing protein [Ruegeria pomeroyi]|uniref:DUF721 domain-containing protein n=1 Tax=Ruegeria pomeroyi TaxID=89184 RepID=UPI001F18E5E9|nr:DUF721 domain-containing protein [Ruegeria pomeroyi]MCE8507098.1 DUF721 domain-containing protein [Ruegeria pomeroyi]